MKYYDSCILQNSKDSESFDQAPTIKERGYRYQDFPMGRLVVNQFSLRHWLAFVLVSIQYHRRDCALDATYLEHLILQEFSKAKYVVNL